jgi:hypothetical protein
MIIGQNLQAALASATTMGGMSRMSSSSSSMAGLTSANRLIPHCDQARDPSILFLNLTGLSLRNWVNGPLSCAIRRRFSALFPL